MLRLSIIFLNISLRILPLFLGSVIIAVVNFFAFLLLPLTILLIMKVLSLKNILSHIMDKKSNTKWNIVIVSLMITLCSVLPCFATNEIIPYESSFLPYNAYATFVSDYSVDGSRFSPLSTCYVYFKGLEPDTDYTFWYYDMPWEKGSSSVTTVRPIVNSYVKRGVIYADGTYRLTSDGNNMNFGYTLADGEFASFEQIHTPPSFTQDGPSSSSYALSVSFTSGSRGGTFDLSKLFITEGSFEEVLSIIAPSPSNGGKSIVLRPGYGLIADLGTLSRHVPQQTVSLSATDLHVSPSFGRSWDTGVRYGFLDSYPSGSISSLPLSPVLWNKVSPNVIGQTRTGSFDFLASSASKRYCIVSNPIYTEWSGGQASSSYIGSSVSVVFEAGFYDLRLFSLNTSFSDSFVTSDAPLPVDFDSSGAFVTDENGDKEYLSTLAPSQNVSDYYYGTAEESLLSRLVSLFESGSRSADNLVNEGQGFFASIRSLFDFLPPELTAVVFSCIVIFLVVCCIKLFR